MAKTIIVIPARYNSQRFCGKVLYPLLGKPVLKWVYDAAINSNIADEVIIATEDKKVIDFAKTIGAKAILTSDKCRSGSDRVWETVKNLKFDFVINLQADEPFIEPYVIRKAFKKLKENNCYDISTACAPISDVKEIYDTNCVKVVVGVNDRAIYFSRLPVPYHHNLSSISKKIPYYKHCGFYIYRKKSLEAFVNFPISQTEELERLEQLRALENGLSIAAVKVKSLGPAIDVPSDIKRAERYYKEMKRGKK